MTSLSKSLLPKGLQVCPDVRSCRPEQRLAVEYDSWEHHGGRTAFRDDRIRDRALTLAGVRVVRLTAFDLGPGAAACAADLRGLLGLGA